MRRRRPSALYTVLDEEQLLGGVDLTDHPDPLAVGPDDESPGEESDWSPGDEGVLGEWSPADEGVAGDWSLGGEGPATSGSTRGARQALRRRAGFVGAAVVVVLVARVLGAALEGVGQRPGLRPDRTPAAGALSAMSRAQPATGAGAPPSQVTAASPGLGSGGHAQAGSVPTARGDARPRTRRPASLVPSKSGADGGVGAQRRAGGSEPAGSAGGSGSGAERVPGATGPAPATSPRPAPPAAPETTTDAVAPAASETPASAGRPVAGGRPGEGPTPTAAGSPEWEFGFER